MAAEGITGSLIKLHKIAEAINQATKDEDEISVNDRPVHYKVKGHFYRWKFVWDCECTDLQTGTSVTSNGWKSRVGALEHGVRDLFQKLGLS